MDGGCTSGEGRIHDREATWGLLARSRCSKDDVISNGIGGEGSVAGPIWEKHEPKVQGMVDQGKHRHQPLNCCVHVRVTMSGHMSTL